MCGIPHCKWWKAVCSGCLPTTPPSSASRDGGSRQFTPISQTVKDPKTGSSPAVDHRREGLSRGSHGRCESLPVHLEGWAHKRDNITNIYEYHTVSVWWFQAADIFPHTCDGWLSDQYLFKGVEATNQLWCSRFLGTMGCRTVVCWWRYGLQGEPTNINNSCSMTRMCSNSRSFCNDLVCWQTLIFWIADLWSFDALNISTIPCVVFVCFWSFPFFIVVLIWTNNTFACPCFFGI